MSLPKLTPTELRLYLRLLAGNAGREELLSLLGDELASIANLHTHLSNMRRKGVRITSSYSLENSSDSTRVVDNASTCG